AAVSSKLDSVEPIVLLTATAILNVLDFYILCLQDRGPDEIGHTDDVSYPGLRATIAVGELNRLALAVPDDKGRFIRADCHRIDLATDQVFHRAVVEVFHFDSPSRHKSPTSWRWKCA